MNRRFFGLQSALLGVLLIGIGSCKKDPTASGVGNPAGLSLEFTARTLAVADSVHTFAIVRDQVGTPLDIPVTLTTGCTPGIVSARTVSDAPQLRTGFFVKALAYGTSCVVATANGFTDTMQITTVPAALVVTQVTGTTTPDTTNSGSLVTYTVQYRDAKGSALAGVPLPTWSSSDTTIAKPTATLGQVAGRAPGLATITFSGSGGVGTSRTLAVLPLTFTGTTVAAVEPGQILKIVRNLADPVFDTNTTVSVGAVIGAHGPDTIRVRVSDVASNGAKSFTMAGVGSNDISYKSGTYTVNTPPAFTGTVTPATVVPSATVWIHRNGGDPVYDLNMRVFRGTSVSNLAALTVDTSTVRADSFKVGTISDLQGGGTYLFQFTRLGAGLATRRGSYVLSVGTWGGTVTPSAAAPANKVVLHRGGADPQFDANTRVYFGGLRTFVDQFSTDTAVVAIPPFGETGTIDMRISRMGAADQALDGAGVITSTTSSLLDATGHTNETPDKPIAITANGNYYLTMSGDCPNGVQSNGSQKCDAYYKITNSTGVDATVTLNLNWFTGVDGDLLICDGAALSNPAPNNVPACGNTAGGADVIDCACSVNGEGPPEFITFTLPANSTYVIWNNLFDGSEASATLMRLIVSGLP